MTHHTNDPTGNEASRSHDAIPIEAGEEAPAWSHAEASGDVSGDLSELADLTPKSESAEEGKPRADAAERKRPRRTGNRKNGAQSSRAGATGARAARHDLEAQGFTADEASRLLDISARLQNSAEAREAEALMRRLRFTRWLIQHGRLDEWSA